MDTTRKFLWTQPHTQGRLHREGGRESEDLSGGNSFQDGTLVLGSRKDVPLISVKSSEPEQQGLTTGPCSLPPAQPSHLRTPCFTHLNSWQQVSLTPSATTSSVSSTARPWLS